MTKIFGDDFRSVSYWVTLTSITLIQVVVVLQFYYPEKPEEFLDPMYAQLGVPILILLLLSILPSAFKGHLAHFKLKNPLPATRAFSSLLNDNRIDVKSLRGKLGNFPRKPEEQNRVWYKLFQEVKSSPEVLAAHKRYILFRDLAVLHGIFLMAWGLCILISGVWLGILQYELLVLFAVNIVLYSLFVISSNNCGNRFAATALAVAAKK